MSKLISDETLYHYGFKGMKWGFNKGKRNGKRVAEEGEMGPYTKDQQEMIDYHTGIKAHDNPDNPVVGPLQFDKSGKPSFIVSMSTTGRGINEIKNDVPKLVVEKQKAIQEATTKEIRQKIESVYNDVLKTYGLSRIEKPTRETTKKILDVIKRSKDNRKKANPKDVKIYNNEVYPKKKPNKDTIKKLKDPQLKKYWIDGDTFGGFKNQAELIKGLSKLVQ